MKSGDVVIGRFTAPGIRPVVWSSAGSRTSIRMRCGSGCAVREVISAVVYFLGVLGSGLAVDGDVEVDVEVDVDVDADVLA